MSTRDLITECQTQIDIAGENASKILVISGRWCGKNCQTFFGVRGEVVYEDKDGLIITFPAKQLMEEAEKRMAALDAAEGVLF